MSVIPIKTKPSKRPPTVEVIDVACPECKCDYILPLMRLRYVKTFSGNRVQVEWPTREGTNECALIACPACAEIYKIETDGRLVSAAKKLPQMVRKNHKK